MTSKSARYIPALNREWLTPLYDPLLRYVMREDVFKQRLIQRMALSQGQRILDIGCGTGTLTLMMQQAEPSASITGLDGDERVLSIARHKAAQAGIHSIIWQPGLVYNLPYPDASFNLVVASMMLHHLTRQHRLETFKEVKRILKPDGSFWIADFGPAHSLLMKVVTVWMSRFEETKDHFDGLLPGMLQEAGFALVTETDRLSSLFGPLSILRATN